MSIAWLKPDTWKEECCTNVLFQLRQHKHGLLWLQNTDAYGFYTVKLRVDFSSLMSVLFSYKTALKVFLIWITEWVTWYFKDIKHLDFKNQPVFPLLFVLFVFLCLWKRIQVIPIIQSFSYKTWELLTSELNKVL